MSWSRWCVCVCVRARARQIGKSLIAELPIFQVAPHTCAHAQAPTHPCSCSRMQRAVRGLLQRGGRWRPALCCVCGYAASAYILE